MSAAWCLWLPSWSPRVCPEELASFSQGKVCAGEGDCPHSAPGRLEGICLAWDDCCDENKTTKESRMLPYKMDLISFIICPMSGLHVMLKRRKYMFKKHAQQCLQLQRKYQRMVYVWHFLLHCMLVVMQLSSVTVYKKFRIVQRCHCLQGLSYFWLGKLSLMF